MPTLRERAAGRLFGDVIERQIGDAVEKVRQETERQIGEAVAKARAELAAVTVRVDDSPGWDSHTAGPADRPWSEQAKELDDVLEAWRKSFLIRRLVTLTRNYVVGGGITISSKRPEVDEFVQAFWTEPRNKMVSRLGPMCDELARAGEIFPVLFTNRVSGMSYVRFPATARQIQEIQTAKKDYERELRYGQIQQFSAEPKWWMGVGSRSAFYRYRGGRDGYMRPLMLHFSINKPLGATRGEGDYGTVLPWAKRYAGWLADRVRLNKRRTRQQMLDVEVPEDQVEAKKKDYLGQNPLEHGVYVHGPGIKVTAHRLNIEADDAKDDGRALRLAVATGGNVGLHYLSEGAGVNFATAKEMGEPTARFYTDRQNEVRRILVDLVAVAFWRQQVVLEHPVDERRVADLMLVTSVTEVARADNQALATAAREIAVAMATAAARGWIDDATALRLILKFAGEALSEDEIKKILIRAKQVARDSDVEDLVVLRSALDGKRIEEILSRVKQIASNGDSEE